MLIKVGRQIRDLLTWFIGTRRMTELAIEQRNILAHTAYLVLLQDPKYRDTRALASHGFKVYSQAEEDGILHEIFHRIGIAHHTFIEIGVSHGRECNTRLLLRQGWKGLWIDGSIDYNFEIRRFFARELATGQLMLVQEFVTRENVDDLLMAYRVDTGVEVDLLSINIDGNDYHVLDAVSTIKPRVIVLEYNPVFAPPIEWVMAYHPVRQWQGGDDYGASLKSYELLLTRKGYALVGCTLNGNNAFFVRSDLLTDSFVSDTSAEYHYEPQRYWLTHGFMGGH